MSLTATFRSERLELFVNVASHLALWLPSVLRQARSWEAQCLTWTRHKTSSSVEHGLQLDSWVGTLLRGDLAQVNVPDE